LSELNVLPTQETTNLFQAILQEEEKGLGHKKHANAER